MDVVEVLRALARRWFISIPLILLTLAGASYAHGRADSTYSTSAVLLFVGPNVGVSYDGETAVEVPQNPLINTNGASIASTATAQSLLGGDVVGQLREAGLDVEYGVQTDNRNPILEVSVESTVPGHALRAVDHLVETARQKLIQRQDDVGAPATSRLGFQVLRMSVVESQSDTAKLRSALMVAAAGLALTVGSAAAAEGLARWRRTRRERGAAERAPDDEGSATAVSAQQLFEEQPSTPPEGAVVDIPVAEPVGVGRSARARSTG